MKQEIEYIYSLTMLEIGGLIEVVDEYATADKWTVALNEDLEVLKRIIKNNKGNVNDCTYEYAVIEKVPINGLQDSGEVIQFYKYNHHQNIYQPSESPFKNKVVGFWM